ncbi:phosphoribosyl-ATP diphosphatase [Candidatus Woesearchaeota archaeon]|nr:phosphoribosyl-ATP diphosphatase [Candidatus Woesearchaeota archaeon]
MYRENMYDVIKGTGERVSALVVPKNNGLKGYAWKVMKEAGLDLESAKELEKGRLKVGDLRVLLRRGEDIPQIVVDEFNNGNIILGLTGDDLYDEYRLKNPQNLLKIENTYDWYDEKARFFRPTLCLINKSGKAQDIPLDARIAVNGKYENTSRNYLQTSPLFDGKKSTVAVYNGDLESTVKRGTNDCCIDTVYSGSSIDGYGLGIVQKIRFSDLVVISPLKTEESFFGKVINREYGQIKRRKENPTCSVTSQLLEDPEKLRRKINEESYELTQALSGKGDVTAESADMLYSTFLALVQRDITLDDIAVEISKRQ